MKNLAIRNTYVKYESISSYHPKVMANVKVLSTVKLQGQRSEGLVHGIK
jgi:hypothetical protein